VEKKNTLPPNATWQNVVHSPHPKTEVDMFPLPFHKFSRFGRHVSSLSLPRPHQKAAIGQSPDAKKMEDIRRTTWDL